MRTQVGIIGAGPAGLILGRLLALQGIESVIIEHRSRAYVEARVRAGMLEQPTVNLLREIGVADRLDREALVHDGFYVRFDRRTHHLNFHNEIGGNSTIYGQQELVKDLIAARLETPDPLLFEVDEVEIHAPLSEQPRIEFTHNGERQVLHCAVVAGCDGAHGVSRQVLLDLSAASSRPINLLERSYPFAWLGILALTRPTTPEGVYCAHPDGFSLHSMRGTELTRQYLQVPADTSLDDWSDDHIWAELTHRSESDDYPSLETGEILERILAPLRSSVLTHFSIGRLFLAGDAAHTVPPAGAKGLNLAVGDVVVLSRAIAGFFHTGSDAALSAYSEMALPRVWRGQLFSWSMTTMLHRFSDDAFEWQLRRAQLERLVTSTAELRAHGENYFGVPFATDWRWTSAA